MHHAGSHSTLTELTMYASRKEGKQDRQCTFNVTLRRVRATVVVVGKNEVLHILIMHL